jgi:hypothetical protein
MRVATINNPPTFIRLSLPAAVIMVKINAIPPIERNGIGFIKPFEFSVNEIVKSEASCNRKYHDLSDIPNHTPEIDLNETPSQPSH